MKFDVIVLGIGGMGSATAYHLARRGAKVLGLEQFGIGHELGSSHGITRIIRLAYAEDPAYVPLLRRAYALWREIETGAKEQLLFITGGLDIGPERGTIVQGSLRSCREHGLAHERLDSAEVNRRFPGYRLPKKLAAVYQPDAGFVLSERAIFAYVNAAQTLGVEIHGHETVRRWEVKRGKVVVVTDRATYHGSRLVITAGPWAAKAVPLLKKLAVPERQVLIWTQPRVPARYQLGAFPVFNMEAPDGRYYGYPIYGVPGFKLGRYHHLNQTANPDRMDREAHPEDEEILRLGIRRYFPGANGPTLAMKTCLFTNSPDGNFILDRHPDFPQVSIATGFSGHGFKFASVVGAMMADLALEDAPALDLFRLGRFSSR